MVTNIAPQYNYDTQCIITYNDNSLQQICNKLGIIFPKKIANKNKFNNCDYISSMENNTCMENENIYRTFEVLSSDYSDEVVYLNFPISFKIEIDANGFYYINEKYNMYVYGETQKEAENNLLNAFREQIEMFCNEEDEKLDKNAQKLKNDLKEVYKYAKTNG